MVKVKKTLPRLAVAALFAAVICGSSTAEEVTYQTEDPKAWLMQQIEVARAKYDFGLELSAVKRLSLMEPDNVNYDIEQLRLMTLTQEPSDSITAKRNDICRYGTEQQCRIADFLLSERYTMLQRMLEQLNSFESEDGEEVLSRLESEFNLRDLDDNTRIELYRFMLGVPSAREEAQSRLQAMINAPDQNQIAARRALELYRIDAYNYNLSRGKEGLYDPATRAASLAHLRQARSFADTQEQRSYVDELIADAGYWEYLAQGQNAMRGGNYGTAVNLLQQAGNMRTDNYDALFSLASAYEASGNYDRARATYQQALAKASTADDRSYIQGRLRSMGFSSRRAAYERLIAQRNYDPQQADALLEEMSREAVAPWDVYFTAEQLLERGRTSEALALYAPYEHDPEYNYSHALILSAAGDVDSALALLQGRTDEDSVALRQRLALENDYRQAMQLSDAGEYKEALAVLKPHRGELEPYMRNSYARLAVMAEDTAEADAALRELQLDPEYAAQARLQMALMQIDSNPRQALAELTAVANNAQDYDLSVYDVMDMAEAFNQAGQPEMALAVYERFSNLIVPTGTFTEVPDDAFAVSLVDDSAAPGTASGTETATAAAAGPRGLTGTDEDFYILEREYAAQLCDMRRYDEAKKVYKKAFYERGMISSPNASDEEYTRAMLVPDFYREADWVTPSMIGNASELYLQRTVRIDAGTTFQRDDGSGGYSDLTALTSTVQVSFPIGSGRGAVIADHIYMDSGSLSRSAYGSKFGRCYASGCNGSSQSDQGVAVAFAYQGEHLRFDIGTAPQGFLYDDDFLGGAGISFDIGEVGIEIEGYRRFVTSSQLSFAGQSSDGVRFGAVRRTGGAINLSWDRGESYGVWGRASVETYRGHKVAANYAVKVMGGWYQRLINENNREWRWGLSAMYWHFKRDLSGYTIGQGGYYSPQQYISAGPNMLFRKRTENWSFSAEAAVGISYSKTRDMDRYPLKAYVHDLPDRDAVESGDSDTGVFARLRLVGMLRTGKHSAVGAHITLQHSEDYSPVYVGLFFTYLFDEWSGSLPMPPVIPEPWTER